MGYSFIRDQLLKEYTPSQETERLFKEHLNSSKWFDSVAAIDFFISYSTKEEFLAIQFAKFLMDQIKGCVIYLYAIDAKTIKNSKDVSLTRIEEILKKSKFVLFLQSDSSIRSYWCAWELGFITALGPNKALIVRITSGRSYTSHREYLKLYPRLMISKDKNHKISKTGYFLLVLRPDNLLGTPLTNYLKGDNEFLTTKIEDVIEYFLKQ